METNTSLSDQLYDVIEKEKSSGIVNNRGRQEGRLNYNQVERRNECFSGTRQQCASSRLKYDQRAKSFERIPQRGGFNKRKGAYAVQERKDSSKDAIGSYGGHSGSGFSKWEREGKESLRKFTAPLEYTTLGFGRNDKERMTGFGFNRLKTLAEKESTEIVMILTSKKEDFNSLLKEDLTPDKIMLLAKIFAKASDCPMEENKAALLAHSVHPNVLKLFSDHSCEVVVKNFRYSNADIVNYFENLSVYYKDIIEILPNTAVELLEEHLKKTVMGLQSLKNFKKITLSEELELRFAKLLSTLDSLTEASKSGVRKKTRGRKMCEWKPSGSDFREVSVFPLPQDVLSQENVQLSPLVVNGPYQSVEHYLNVQFHLMREDFINPLRSGIMNFIEQTSTKNSRLKRIENVRFYKGVQFLTQFVEGDALVTEVLFNPRGKIKNVNWKRSKRFMFGSLVCFSDDFFRTILLGTVVNRDIELLEKGIFKCELLGDFQGKNVFGKEFVMAENEIYFEAYQHVLKALKNYTETNFPLREYIIDVSSEVFLPRYVAVNPDVWYHFAHYRFQVLNPDTWPSIAELKVNESQSRALHSALTQRLVVIQGPPGTGKTYLGLLIARLLLENSDCWRQQRRGPILVVCYTNHALDQFLEGILKISDNIIRVGGQSKNEKMGEYNLRIRRRKRTPMNSALSEIVSALETCTSRMEKVNILVKEVQKKLGILSLKFLNPWMSTCHKSWFYIENEYKDSLLTEWLLEGAFLHSSSTSEEGNIRLECISEDMAILYACSLAELQSCIFQLESEIVSAVGDQFEYLMNIKDIYISRFFYLRSQLMEPISQDTELIGHLNQVKSLAKLNNEQRWVLYNYWVSEAVHHHHKNLVTLGENYDRLNSQKSEILDALSLEAMLDADVVGITTTGAARQQALLQKLGAKIVIVEEAAEVMESHVIVSLSDKCQHLILIGDHKQLRPSPAVYKLAKDYNMDISLFERMLMNNVPYDILDIQHRMRPEIADLIIPAIYPALKNHESVLKYENIVGISKNLFFITHNHPEELVIDGTSKSNVEEAKFLIALCRHLILQGYDPSQITILTVYIGQMFTLVEEREKHKLIKDVRITCVDNYQGEENDIILLSLVRNNEEGKIGFVASDNRLCVALSRAKKGLYIMGNIEMLSAGSSLWSKVREILEKKKAVGTHLKLQCLKHPSQLTDVCKAEDFVSITEGGCTLMCNTKLNCGHICKKMCHIIGHDNYKCHEICGKRMCIRDHRCEKICWQKCGDCMVPLQCELPCGHSATLPCHRDPSEHRCKEVVSVELPDCKHTAKKECHIDVKDVSCPFPCDSRLPCGHVCEWKCHVTNDPEHQEYKCKRPCGRKNLECKDDHMCQKRCFEECSQCTYRVKRKLPNCEHFYDMECSANPGTIQCHKPCKKMLPCGHKCPLKCVEECGGCQVVVEKEIPDCKHKIKIKCSKIPERSMCTLKCERTLTCGHECKNKCGQPCTSKTCDALLRDTVKSPCGHDVRLFCHEHKNGFDAPSLVKRCMEPCSKILECSHRCKGTCGGCMQGRVHIPCEEKCGKNLICGHECTVSCSKSCPPCKKPCFVKCEHSKCKKKCGVPCVSCKEPCGWRCKHLQCKRQCGEICDRPPCNEPCLKKIKKCGHPCIGFCGEACPPLCRECDAEELDEILTYFGAEDDARFVFLPECKCVLACETLEKWFDADSGNVKMKVCPKCTTPIQNVRRFGNIVKQHFVDVLKVKHRIFGGVGNTKSSLAKASLELSSVVQREEFMTSRAHLNLLQDILRRSKKDRLNAFELNSLESRSQFVLSVAKSFKEVKCRLDQLKLPVYYIKANALVKIILRRLEFISPQEHSDLSGECMRFNLILQMAAVENSPGFKTHKGSWYKNYEECKALLSSLGPFPLNLYDETHRKISELSKLLLGPVALTKLEMDSIVKAINLHQGHWYTCPNGHVYVIGECGRAMEHGRCYECGERIGGSHHALHHTNRSTNIPQGI